MLTRAQIQRLAQRQRVGMQVQERDYLQHLLLLALTGRSQGLVFKGGTALRLVYRGNRFSEDLDFNIATDVDSLRSVAALRSLWQQVVDDLVDFGVVAETRNEWEGELGYSLDVILGPKAASEPGQPSAEARRYLDEVTGPHYPRVYRNAILLAVPSLDGLEAARARILELLG